MKPILLYQHEVKGILAERQSQIRRIVKPQPDESKVNVRNIPEGFLRSPCRIGDILWVRETWCKTWAGYDIRYMEQFNTDIRPMYIYKSDGEMVKGIDYESVKWQPSIHMPREAARIFLRVTNVRLQRLQDISEEDAVAEGVEKLFDYLTKEKYMAWASRAGEYKIQEEQPYKNYLWHGHFGDYGTGNKQSDEWSYQYSTYESARDSFSSLWESINKKYGCGWATNSWVWAYTFERISKEEVER